jgi:photosystem II stability/assembly factor-like uncharacterized protein
MTTSTRVVLGAALCCVAAAPFVQQSGTSALLIGIHVVSDQVVWAAGARGTVTRSTDGGATWTAGKVSGADSLQFRDVHALDARTAWVLSIGNGPQSRIYHTRDAGATWQAQFVNADSTAFYDCMDFWDARRGVVIGDATGNAMAVLLTGDGGATWRRVDPRTLPEAQPSEGSFAASGTCVETGEQGRAWIVMSTPTRARLLRTADYGRTWALETLPITTHEGSGPQSVIFRDAMHGMVLGGGYASKPSDTLIAVTSDGGDTWTPRNAPPFKVGTWGGTWVPGAQRPTVVAVGPSGAAVSSDEGRTWTVLDTLNYWTVGASSPKSVWAAGTQGRVTRFPMP